MARIRRFARLAKIENNAKISTETNPEFIYELQRAILLALCEQVKLTNVQLEFAIDKLKQQRIQQGKKRK